MTADMGQVERQRLAGIVETALNERDEAAQQRDALIVAIRDGLSERDPEWFPDGFPDHLAAIDAVQWMAAQLADDYGTLPSRWP